MNIEVGDHPAIDKLATYKVTGKLDSLLLVQLARDGKLDFAGKLGILAQLGGFNVIPQPFAVAPLLGRILGQHHLGMNNPGLTGEVVLTVEPLVVKPCRREIVSAQVQSTVLNAPI